jgi:hypothetical protein
LKIAHADAVFKADLKWFEADDEISADMSAYLEEAAKKAEVRKVCLLQWWTS